MKVCCYQNVILDDWLTVHRSITLVDLQLDEQNSYLFTYNTFIKILYMFRALSCSSSGGLRRNCIYATCGIVTLCRWLSCAPVEEEGTRCCMDTIRHLEDEQGTARNMYRILINVLPYILESNPLSFYGFRGLKNQMRIRCAVEGWILEKWWSRCTCRKNNTLQ
jgi:hypothetical protein